ncbi:MAG: radical SAM protein [bacterium]|nr:radical SAM protein [bacterium]
MDTFNYIYTADITVNYKCNQNCLFCSIGHMRKDLNKSTDEIKQDIWQAKNSGAKVLGFGGGEPTIRKDLFELIRFARGLEFPVIRLQTNGMMLGYEPFVEKVLEAGANFFKFSIHSHIPRIHDRLTRVEGSFAQAIKGIENLKKRGFSVEVDIVINKLNYKFIPQFIDFFIAKGISKFCFISMIYEGNSITCRDEIAVKISEIIPYLQDALEIIDTFRLDKGVIFNIPFCFMPSYVESMAESGDFNTLVITPEDKQVLDFSKFEGKLKGPNCNNCKYYEKCPGLWEQYAEYFGFDELKPIGEE